METQIELGDISVDVVLKDIKNIHLSVYPPNGRVRISAPSRMGYYEQFQRMIDEYNAGAKNVDAFFTELVSFAQGLNQEEQRGIAKNLNEEELALFDLLTKPKVKLSRSERDQVKRVARDLLDTLKAERLVLDWRKSQ